MRSQFGIESYWLLWCNNLKIFTNGLELQKQQDIIIFIMGYTKGQLWCCLLLLLLSCCLLCVHSHGEHHGQVSGDPHPPITRLDKNMVQDKDHIMEHLDGVIDKPESDMTPQELQLHYFKMHDYDGNNLLDGLELATAITHVHKEEKGENSTPMKEQELISIIDQVLRDDDKNNDGYIDYAEFAKSLQ